MIQTMQPIFAVHFQIITRFTGVLLIFFFSFSTSAQTIDCEKVKDTKPTFIRKGAISIELDDSTRLDMRIFSTCGDWDDIDKKVFEWPNIVTAIIDYGDIVEDETYGQILRVVTRYKATEEYELARNEAILELDALAEAENPKKKPEVSSTKAKLVVEPAQKNGVFYQLNDLASAVEAGKLQGKKVLIYFTCWACVNARKIEDRVLIDKKVQAVLAQNYLCFSAYTDDRALVPGSKMTIGEKNTQLQLERFKSPAQPHFCILDEEGNMISQIHYTQTIELFLAFLNKGLE